MSSQYLYLVFGLYHEREHVDAVHGHCEPSGADVISAAFIQHRLLEYDDLALGHVRVTL